MLNMILIYVFMILCKRTWEWVWWMEKARKKTPGIKNLPGLWWEEHKFQLAENVVLGIPLGALWFTGWLTPFVSAGVNWIYSQMGQDPGIATLPVVVEVNALTTMPAALIIDTVGKPMAKKLMELAQKYFGQDEAPAKP